MRLARIPGTMRCSCAMAPTARWWSSQASARRLAKLVSWTPQQYCEQLKRVDQRFVELTGAHLDPLWRAPAGRTSPRLLDIGKACGYAHVGWSPAGFSGDELSSEKYPNPVLLQKSLRDLRGGDIVLIHMGIWSRKDAMGAGQSRTSD